MFRGRLEGVAGLARLARQTGRPEALRAWCRALAERGQWADALRAYKEAVEVVGKSHSRGGFLDGAALAAQQLGRRDATKCLEAAWLGGAALRCIPPSCERSSRGAVWFDRVGYAVMINSDDAPSIMKIGKLVRNFQTRKLEPRETPGSLGDHGRASDDGGLLLSDQFAATGRFFLERVLGVQKLWFDGDRLQRSSLLGGEAVGYIPVSASLYAGEKTGVIALSRVEDPLAGPVVHAGTTVLKPASALLVYGQLAIAILWALAIGTSLIYFLIWGVRRLRKKIAPGADDPCPRLAFTCRCIGPSSLWPCSPLAWPIPSRNWARRPLTRSRSCCPRSRLRYSRHSA